MLLLIIKEFTILVGHVQLTAQCATTSQGSKLQLNFCWNSESHHFRSRLMTSREAATPYKSISPTVLGGINKTISPKSIKRNIEDNFMCKPTNLCKLENY